MGQFFKAVNLDTLEQIKPNSYSKLTEFCFVGNKMPDEVCRLMLPKNQWHSTRVLFIGNYCRHDKKEMAFRKEILERIPPNIKSSLEENSDLYDIFSKLSQKDLYGGKQAKHLFNHTKRQYVNVLECPKNEEGDTIHPLCLLTAVGNGKGGGDYYGQNGKDFVGFWAGDIISTGNQLDYPAYEKINPGFIED